MNELPHTIRLARHDDAAGIARVYIDAWHDAYPGLLPGKLLRAMTLKGQGARWRAAIAASAREAVLVAEAPRHGIVGMASVGVSRDRDLGFDAEVYTLYVDPNFYGRGIGRALLKESFAQLRKKGLSSCIIWAHAKNHARFFYEAMGGRLAAERTTKMMGEAVPEIGFGWKTMALAEKSAAR
jgi:GNAT superfamily N-acetyltransferase